MAEALQEEASWVSQPEKKCNPKQDPSTISAETPLPVVASTGPPSEDLSDCHSETGLDDDEDEVVETVPGKASEFQRSSSERSLESRGSAKREVRSASSHRSLSPSPSPSSTASARQDRPSSSSRRPPLPPASETAPRTPSVPSDTAADEDTSKVPKKKALGQVLFNASHSDYEVVADVAESRGWKVVKSEEQALKCNIHWIDDSAIGDWMRKVEPWMRINHFPGMNNSLARKTRLARNMGRMQRLFPAEYRFIPPTWVLPDDLGDLERKFGPETESKAFYIVKPDHLCQGRGIFLTTELERLRQVAADSRKKDEATVVQRYIMRPMLIDGLKFDLRLYFGGW
jgi:hypothetical protein